MIKVYGIPNCNKIKNTRTLLDSRHLSYEFIDVKKNPLSSHKLQEISRHLGLEKMFNTKGTTYRRLNLDFKNMDDRQRLEWLAREPSMIRRPLIEKNEHYLIGFDEPAILQFVIDG